MYGTGYIFSKKFFTGKPLSADKHQRGEFSPNNIDSSTGWVVVGIIWIFCSLFGVGLFPVYEGRNTLVNTFKFIALDLSGKKHPGKRHDHNVAIEGEGEEKSGHESAGQDIKNADVVTPTEK